MKYTNAWVQTFTGKKATPFMFDADSIDILDIAHSLAIQCRYNGHINTFYSVAQHSINASYLVYPDIALEALLHDAAEYLIGDLARPIKQQVPEYQHLDALVTQAINRRFELRDDPDTIARVKLADNWLVVAEARRYMRDDLTGDWGLEQPELDGDEPPLYWQPIAPDVCRELFIMRFDELWAARHDQRDLLDD